MSDQFRPPIVDPLTAGLALGAVILLLLRVGSVWIIAAGAAAGLVNGMLL